MSPSIEIIAASISKKGHRPDENEDAWAVRYADDAVFAAVADGATESVYAGRWADALSRCLTEPQPWRAWLNTESPPSEEIREQIDHARTVWAESVDASESAIEDLPWYVSAKREQGAFATMLGLALFPAESTTGDDTGRLFAASVGDCGLFQALSPHEYTGEPPEFLAWPHDDPEMFTNRPELVSSRASRSDREIQFQADDWTPGDVIVLATDAVAAWLLREDPVLPTSDDEADAWLRRAQSDGRLRNDDSTIVILKTREP